MKMLPPPLEQKLAWQIGVIGKKHARHDNCIANVALLDHVGNGNIGWIESTSDE
jgi:hypothetical protein